MADLTEQSSSLPVKLTGATLSGAETNYVNVDSSGNINSVNNNGSGASAVNIQDGGNSITVDATALPLPAGAATSANQATEIANLSSIDTKLTTTNSSLASIDAGIPTALGQTTMSASMPVTIASNQSVLSVQLPNDLTATGTIVALNGTVVADGAGQPYASFLAEIAGTWSSGTAIVFESSTDNTNWITTYAIQTNTATSTPNNGSSGGFGRLAFRGMLSGFRYVRARANTYTVADSVTVKFILTAAPGMVVLEAALPMGDNTLGRTKITDGTDVAAVTAAGDLKVVDGLRDGGVYGLATITIGSTPIEAKVGGSRLAQRKFLQITANAVGIFYGLSNAVTTTSGTPIASGQTVSFSVDPDSTFQVWLCATTNGKTVNIIECP